ncbi:MAG: hypothetical protein KDJ36_04075 [Hyphomicrobiaceae bacterium]|nr:hypothetical protein [Hyphomicrobiaceae bacterium]
MPQVKGMGVAWFREEDWPRWLEIDPNFQPDYQHWLSRSEHALRDLAAKGMNVKKVMMDPDEFLAWCKKHGYASDAQNTRAMYVSLAAAGDIDGKVRFPDKGKAH